MIKAIIKKLLSLNVLLPLCKGRRFIFIYHDISAEDSVQYSKYYSTKPDVFCRQLDFFKKHFTLVSLDDIASATLDKNKNYACIVFDDGFKSVKETAAPILKQKNIPFAVFVNKMAVLQNRLWLSDLQLGNNDFTTATEQEFGKKNDLIDFLKSNEKFNNSIEDRITEKSTAPEIYMNEADIIELKNDGVTIGSHTLSHPVLSMCNTQVQQREIEENKNYIDHLLGQQTKHFAFPFGKKEHFTTETVELLLNAGHQYLYTSNPAGYKKEDIVSGLIPRIGLENDSEQQLMFYINRQFIRKINL